MPLLNFSVYLENSFKLYILFGELYEIDISLGPKALV